MQSKKYNPFSPPPRNSRAGLAERAMKNLDNIMRAYEVGGDVHVVTQVIITMQAVVVFPWEAQAFQSVYNRPFSNFSAIWKVTTDTYGDRCTKLGLLLEHVRNAISHRGLEFSSDSRLLKEVTITFTDRYYNKKHGINYLWIAEIQGDSLYEFCHAMLHELRNFKT